MLDAQQAAYDAVNKENKQLKNQVEYYKRLAVVWQEVAERLIMIVEALGSDDEQQKTWHRV